MMGVLGIVLRLTLVLVVYLTGASTVPISPPYYRSLSQEQAARLGSWSTTAEKQNIWQLSGQTEGDMILRPGQRNGLVDLWYRWNNYEIPYELDPIFDANQANQIHEALKTFAAVSCITARPRTPADSDYVYVTGDNSGCWSYVGRIRGRQYLNLQTNGCVWDHIIIHEFLHAAGFYHQQSSTERDDYVAIQWQNISPGTEHNFDKFGPEVITNFGQPYDYYSVMHYDAWAFSYNGEPTIIPHDASFLNIIGQTYQISQIDINKLNLMYC